MKIRSEEAAIIADSIFKKMVLLRKQIPDSAIPELDYYALTRILIADRVIKTKEWSIQDQKIDTHKLFYNAYFFYFLSSKSPGCLKDFDISIRKSRIIQNTLI